MRENKKIAIILPYFGKLPDLASYYFRSCQANPEVSFLLFTDQKIDEEISPNLIVRRYTLGQFRKLAERKLNIRLKIKYPYKLCDFKPMYGHIFEDYLEGYQFWGYTDLDMILGSVKAFLTDKELDRYDIITSRRESFAGNFTIFRNTTDNKYLYQACDNWQNILKNYRFVFSFPEQFKQTGRPVSSGLLYRISIIFLSPEIRPSALNDLNDIVKSMPEIKVLFGNFILSDELFRNLRIADWEVTLNEGRFVENNSGKQGLYFHSYRLKHRGNFKVEQIDSADNLQRIVITQNGIRIRN